MRAAAVLFLTLFLLRALTAEANDALSGAHVWLFSGGLFIAYPALMASFEGGFAVAVLAGVMCDSVSPVPFGTQTALFAVAHVVVYSLRERVRRDETAVRVAVALLVNLAFFLVLSFARIRHVPAGASAWPRLFCDLAWSELAVALAGPWFLAFQMRAVELARANPAGLA